MRFHVCHLLVFCLRTHPPCFNLHANSLAPLPSVVHIQHRTCGPTCTTLFGFRQCETPLFHAARALTFLSVLLAPALSVKHAAPRVPPSCCPPACASPLFHAARELSLLHLSSTVHTQRRTCGPKCTTLFGFRQNAQPPCFMLRGHSSFPHSSRRPHGA